FDAFRVIDADPPVAAFAAFPLLILGQIWLHLTGVLPLDAPGLASLHTRIVKDSIDQAHAIRVRMQWINGCFIVLHTSRERDRAEFACRRARRGGGAGRFDSARPRGGGLRGSAGGGGGLGPGDRRGGGGARGPPVAGQGGDW